VDQYKSGGKIQNNYINNCVKAGRYRLLPRKKPLCHKIYYLQGHPDREKQNPPGEEEKHQPTQKGLAGIEIKLKNIQHKKISLKLTNSVSSNIILCKTHSTLFKVLN
jgi:hypothetical protein